MATPLDLAIIESFTRGANVPVESQAGYAMRADEDGTNYEFVGAVETAGSHTWDGKVAQILVGGSGARSIVLKNGYYLGQRVDIVDAVGNAASGTITVSVSEGAIGGTVTITANGGGLTFMYVSAGQWRRFNG